MLYHHDSRDYDVAASEAAKKARSTMEQAIERGRSSAVRVLEEIEANIPNDRMITGRALDFVPVGQGLEVSVQKGEIRETIHEHAMSQFAERAGLPMRLVRHLREMSDDDHDWPAETGRWPTELLAHNLRELYAKGPASGRSYLMRSIGGDVRGWLSDRFRRLDSRPLVESFVQAFTKLGAVPLEGHSLPTKVGMKCILPMVFEPVPNEVLCFTAGWGNSDFGDGTHVLGGGMFRLWCTNQCIMSDVLRQVHLGKKLDGNFAFSQRTYELDTKTSASAVTDMVEHLLAPDSVHKMLAGVKKAHEEEIPATSVGKYLIRHLSKNEAKTAEDSFNSQDVVNLPPGNTKWRLSNCISLLARDNPNDGRKLELEKIAGKVLVN